jgi:hypothetical protein
MSKYSYNNLANYFQDFVKKLGHWVKKRLSLEVTLGY